jgi:hypothetical protein
VACHAVVGTPQALSAARDRIWAKLALFYSLWYGGIVDRLRLNRELLQKQFDAFRRKITDRQIISVKTR